MSRRASSQVEAFGEHPNGMDAVYSVGMFTKLFNKKNAVPSVLFVRFLDDLGDLTPTYINNILRTVSTFIMLVL